MIVLKLKQPPINDPKALLEQAQESWRITPTKLLNQPRALVVYKGTVLEEYEVLGFHPSKSNPNKIAFDFKPVANSLFKNRKIINYNTANPCTVPTELTISV